MPSFIFATSAVFAQAQIKQAPWNGWETAYQIYNDSVEIVVVPAVGRILHYAEIGGENLLWQHPQQIERTGPPPTGGRGNVGGDKIWPWPDESWPLSADGQARPPAEWEQEAHETQITGPRSLRMVSPVWGQQGLQIVRDISLAPTGTRVTLTSRIQRVGDAGQPMAESVTVVPWSVTQMRPAQAVLVDYIPEAGRGYDTHGTSWRNLLELDRNTLWLPAPDGGAAKIGVSGRALGWWRKDTLMVQLLLDNPSDTPEVWAPYTQAQVFWTEHPHAPALSYIELEFTAPVRPDVAGGSSAPLSVAWEIHKLSSSRPPMDQLLAWFRQIVTSAHHSALPVQQDGP